MTDSEIIALRRRHKYSFWGKLLTITIISIACWVIITQYLWQKPTAQVVQSIPEISELQQHVDNLETRLDALNLKMAEVSTSDGISELHESIKDLGSHLTQVETHEGQNQQGWQDFAKELTALLALREAIKAGQPFAQQLADLRASISGDQGLQQKLAKLDPLAATATPTRVELRDDLIQEEMAMKTTSSLSADATIWEEIKSKLQSLVAVHSLHDPQLASIEATLASDDPGATQQALVEFQQLPQEIQKNLLTWQIKLTRRIDLDAALPALTDLVSGTAGNKQ